MARLIAMATSLWLIAATATAQPAAVQTPERDRLNPEDCKVMAVLGREWLHWDRQKPDLSMFAIFYRPQGGGYVEQCPWRAMGVTPLPPGQPDLHNMRFFTQPRYADDGRSASVNFVTRLVAIGADGKPLSPFVQVETCTLTKPAEDWIFQACALAAIT